MFAQLFRGTVGRVDEGVDGISDLAGGVVFMQFAFNALLGQLSIKLHRSHVREP
jgi:hypothetical protein